MAYVKMHDYLAKLCMILSAVFSNYQFMFHGCFLYF